MAGYGGLPLYGRSSLLALSADGILSMLADTMFLEAFENGGPWVAIVTPVGFSAALLAEFAQ